MTWRYGLIPQSGGYKIAEIYGDECYAELNSGDWWFESKEEAIECLEIILKDLRERKDNRNGKANDYPSSDRTF